MRVVNCDQGHEIMRFAAETDDELMVMVREHAAERHPELTEEQIQGIFAQLVHDE